MTSDKKNDEWMTKADTSMYVSEWIGALFFYLIRLGNKKMKLVNSSKNRKRNVIVGFILQLLIIPILFILVLYILSS